MRGVIQLYFVTLVFARSPHTIAPRQPHLEYGQAALYSTTSFLKDSQRENFDSNNLFINSIEEPLTHTAFIQNLPPRPNGVATNSLQKLHENVHSQYESVHLTDAPIISKRFFLHSAPEETEEIVQQKHITIGKPRKNYNIVFIKTPPNNVAQRTLLKIRKAPNEERTAIYVLAEKHGGNEIYVQVQEPITTTAKPEVYFINYKTKAEAEYAEHAIKSQYDALGGSTETSNEDVVPVTSVVGALDEVDETRHAIDLNNGVYASNSGVDQTEQIQENLAKVHPYQVIQMEAISSVESNNGYLPPI